MKAKFIIDITIINDCGTELHVVCSSSGCEFTTFLCKKLDFDLEVLKLQNEELDVLLASLPHE